MNVTCPNCATIYRVDPAKVPEGGVRARCNVCSAVFAVKREGEPALAPAVQPQRAEPAKAQPPRPEPPRVAVPAASPHPASPVAPIPGIPPRPASPQRPVGPAAPAPVASTPAAATSTPATPTGSARPAPPAAAPPAAPSRPPAPPARPAGPTAPAAPKPAAPAAGPPAAPPPRAAPSAPAGGRPTNPFLSQDPALKARRLARALISDMVVYHPGKRQEGLRDGNLKELFEDEIKKSWEEYAEQVGRELAESTAYFREALNEILAGGRQVF
jgi:predicted Zn finger-like uncharacterized protein